MDYVVLSTLMDTPISMLVISYDIACQWMKNFLSRLLEFPQAMQLDLENISLDYVIPKFHIYTHGRNCQTVWSLNYRRWMGRTDGEGVEREWSHINPVALSTKVMGPGAHHDTLDDHWGAWNWQKVVSLGMFHRALLVVLYLVFTGCHLHSKLKEAIPMTKKHCALLNALSATFSASTVAEWTQMVEDWQEDPLKPDPFEEVTLGLFLAYAIAPHFTEC
jgi:hypothetical protein